MPRVAHVIAESEIGYAVKVRAGRHQLTADEPRSGGGTDTGPNPYSLLLAALGACTSITLRMYGERKAWALGAIRVDLDHDKEGDADRIVREIHFSAALSEEQRQKLAEIAERTPVTLTLKRGAEIATTLHSGSA